MNDRQFVQDIFRNMFELLRDNRTPDQDCFVELDEAIDRIFSRIEAAERKAEGAFRGNRLPE